ncbi:MAG TPA: RDD family protein [Pyrinomonadaceae bacterium]|nr:RDD family protein [Pyrinomonadaceae bacterium]
MPSGTVDAAHTGQATASASTLIEFPGARSMPQWRKQLSERVREIQERRAREATRDVEEVMPAPLAPPTVIETSAPPLGLVPPPPPAQEMNPLVVAALRRIERARQPQSMPPVARSRGGAAVARVAEEQYQDEINPALLAPLSQAEQAAVMQPVETARERTLVVVSAPVKEEPSIKPEPDMDVEMLVNDTTLTQLETEALTESTYEDEYDDRAPVIARLTASAIDFLVVAFASSPFAAVIELTNGNWSDPRVTGSMGAIVLVVMFLYLTASTALAGRTWGMSLLSLRAVDADTGLQPTTRQAIVRALLYMVSLAAFGLGVIYALLDAEGRTAHDYFSSTAVVQE